jgi:hypothetical protein
VADAAAMSTHWVYDVAQLSEWEAQLSSEAAKAGATAAQSHRPGGPGPGLEFLDPPRSPFYSYPQGSNTPYGQQTAVLLGSLSEQGGLDCARYADALRAYFGTGFTGYRDASTKVCGRDRRDLVPRADVIIEHIWRPGAGFC